MCCGPEKRGEATYSSVAYGGWITVSHAGLAQMAVVEQRAHVSGRGRK